MDTNIKIDGDNIIKSTKPSKYKKTGEWIEWSGELSIEEMENLFACEKIDLTDEDREFLLNLKTKAVSKDRLVY